jgi:hypothetical protein
MVELLAFDEGVHSVDRVLCLGLLLPDHGEGLAGCGLAVQQQICVLAMQDGLHKALCCSLVHRMVVLGLIENVVECEEIL